jgi:carbon-monoxide dehydrogenase medium subunit
LAQHGQDARIIAGGTDLLMDIRRKKVAPRLLVGVTQIPELNGIRAVGDGLWIGAATTHHAITASPLVGERFPLLAAACLKIGSRQIRNVATIGGNICNAAVCADTAPALLALDAVVEVRGFTAERRLPIAEFFTGPGRTALLPCEIVLGFHIPATWRGAGAAYIKHTWRNALDIQMVGAAAVVQLDPCTRACTAAHLALGVAGPIPMRAIAAEAALVGQPIDATTAREVGRIAAGEARPRTSHRATAEYRRQVLEVLVQRAILEAANGLNTR